MDGAKVSGVVSEEAVDTFDLTHFEETTDVKIVHITANESMRFLFISGEPIKAPVVVRGRFQQVFLGYEHGVFVPNQPK